MLGITFFAGVQLLSLWIMSEYIARIYDESKNRPQYIIEKKIKFLEEINENINGLDYIEHMYYINSTIGGLKKYIADIRIREYLEDYL